MHLRQPRFTYSTCGLFTKNKEKIQKFNETGDSRYIYQNELSKSCFQHDMAYKDFKDLPRRLASDQVLRDKAFNVVKTPKYNGYQRGLASVVNRFFEKKSLDDDVTIKLCQINSQPKNYANQLLENLKKRKVFSSFKNNISGADLADIQLIRKFNKEIRFIYY